jgi:glycoprotease/Kae1 family metallohydrolase
MICLGIECTAHTFGAAILKNKEILSNVKDMYQTKSGGIIPIEASKHHEKLGPNIIDKAIKQASINENQIDLISFSQGPGLPPTLKAGRDLAVNLAKKLNIPIIGVNHLLAHLEIGKLLTKAKNPVFILATGANTQIISLEGNKYRILGECLSIGLGNALDKFGRSIGLGFPCGPKIEALAKLGKYVELPYVVKAMDVEFSGIITKATQLHKKGISKEDLCFSLQETLFSMLTEVTERALSFTNKNEALLIGGVAANKRLTKMLSIMCNERSANFSVVPLDYAGDQAAMIAYLGILQHKHKTKDYNIDFDPNWRLDSIEIDYR